MHASPSLPVSTIANPHQSAPAPDSVAGLSSWRAAAELPRALWSIATLPFAWPRLARAPRGDGHAVLVIPGFGTTDRSTLVLRSYLDHLGHDVRGWELGLNLGARTIGIDNRWLLDRLDHLADQSGRRVSLVGWSMGGIMARMIARERPDAVRRIVTLGAPFTGDPYANRAWRVYERMSGHSLSHPIARRQIAESKLVPPVPATSIYSTSDGVVDWRCCIEPDAPHTESIAVRSAHCGFGFNARVLEVLAERLARPEA